MDTTEVLDSVIGVNEAAEILGINRNSVIDAITFGRLPGKKIGRSWVLSRQSVLLYEVDKVKVRAGNSTRKT